MDAADVVTLWTDLEAIGVEVWLDGGWAVDALLGHQTRPHDDVDIVVQQRDVPAIRSLLADKGYIGVERDDTSAWNFVLGDERGHEVDIHAIVFDDAGNGLYGPPEKSVIYPAESLTGEGEVAGRAVRCISVEWLVRFHTGYDLDDDDYRDVLALHERFGVALPAEYRDRE
jgi:lincosamide nucleotidyltransferase A/C/D/E